MSYQNDYTIINKTNKKAKHSNNLNYFLTVEDAESNKI